MNVKDAAYIIANDVLYSTKEVEEAKALIMSEAKLLLDSHQ